VKKLLCSGMNLPNCDEGEECSKKESTPLHTEDMEFLHVFREAHIGVCLHIVNLEFLFVSCSAFLLIALILTNCV
jgi:hypothetical protein